MKKAIFIILTLIFSSTFAQDIYTESKDKLSFEVKAGYLQSTLTGSDLDRLSADGKVKSFHGYFIGGGLKNPLGKNWSFKHEIFFQNYGANFKNDLGGDTRLNMNSIQLNPINVVYDISGFQLYAGPYVNMLISSCAEWTDANGNRHRDNGIYGTPGDNQEEGNYLQKTDMGMVLGLEYQFDFRLIIGAKFTRGFSYIFDNSHAFDISDMGRKNYKIYNQSFGFYLGYSF